MAYNILKGENVPAHAYLSSIRFFFGEELFYEYVYFGVFCGGDEFEVFPWRHLGPEPNWSTQFSSQPPTGIHCGQFLYACTNTNTYSHSFPSFYSKVLY